MDIPTMAKLAQAVMLLSEVTGDTQRTIANTILLYLVEEDIDIEVLLGFIMGIESARGDV